VLLRREVILLVTVRFPFSVVGCHIVWQKFTDFWRKVFIHLARIEVLIVVLLKIQSWDITLCH